MVRFIVCEDNETFLNNTCKIITKIMMPLDVDYKIHKYRDYNNTLEKLIDTSSELKIYLLDIELPSASGLDIASKIREKDWNSVIVILTAHNEFKMEALGSRLMLLDFISKFINYEKRLEDSLKIGLRILNKQKVLSYKYDHVTYRIAYDEILYFIKEGLEKKCTIVTETNNFTIAKTLKELKEELDPYFYQAHKSCLVNVSKIRKIDCNNNEIVFKNGTKLNIISNKYKKGLVEYVKNY